jgi:hypothetical protein
MSTAAAPIGKAAGRISWGAAVAAVPVSQAPHCHPASPLPLAHLSFPSPPHIPTDIVAGWRVRRAGPAQVGRFRHAHLYGKFQKSTAATQTVPRPRTRISTIATRGTTPPGSRWEAAADLGAREVRVQFADLPYTPTHQNCRPTLYTQNCRPTLYTYYLLVLSKFANLFYILAINLPTYFIYLFTYIRYIY